MNREAHSVSNKERVRRDSQVVLCLHPTCNHKGEAERSKGNLTSQPKAMAEQPHVSPKAMAEQGSGWVAQSGAELTNLDALTLREL